MAGWVMLLSIAVKIFSLPRALRLVSTKTRCPVQAPRDETQKKLGQIVDRLLKTDLLILKPSCWKRAALLHRYLALNGMPTRILFGMRREPDGSVSGHAWLESGGEAILESTAPNYSVTYAFPSHDTLRVLLLPANIGLTHEDVEVDKSPQRRFSVGINGESRAFVGNCFNPSGLESLKNAAQFGGQPQIARRILLVIFLESGQLVRRNVLCRGTQL
jgi:hypothetical protein